MRATIENPNIRISPHAKAALREMAKMQGKSMQTVLDEAIDHYQRDKFMDEANAAYARLKSDPESWREEMEERQTWDVTSRDGVEEE